MEEGANCNSKTELKKGPWTREEDQKLLAYIQEHGYGSWRTLPTVAGLQRCGKSCRLRWTNYLRPDIKRGKFTTHEEKTIIRLHALLGNRWSAIAAHLPKRTDNEIKNYWNTRLKKRLTRMGIDPATHKPKAGSTRSSTLSHMAQWEAARLEAESRLEAEARFARESKLFYFRRQPPPPPCLDVLKVWQATTINPTIPNPNCSFFRSVPNTLESPTSTLNFSSAPTVLDTISSNDAVPTKEYYACGVGQVDCYADDVQLQPQGITGNSSDYPWSYDCELAGAVLGTSCNQDSDSYNMNPLDVGDQFEEDKSYWNYLLNLVSSPMMESSSFL